MRNFLLKIILAAAAFLLFQESAFAENTAFFPDVSLNHPNFTAIETLRSLGFIKGYPDGYFRPSQRVNRAEAAAMITRAMTASPDPGTYKNCFSDVRKEWFAKYVCYGKGTLWLSGYPGTQEFRPGSDVIVVELFRMTIDAFKVPRLAATEYLKRKWDVPYGYKNVGRSLMPPQWYEDYLVTAREFGFLDTSPLAAKMMNRAEIAEIIYRILIFKDKIQPPERQKISCVLPISKPPRVPSVASLDYCSFENPAVTGTQIIINETSFSNVWGQDFSFQIPEKSWALAAAYAGERFNINPAYLFALAIKESRLNCAVNTQGCFQVSPSAFADIKSQFPQYFENLSYDSAQSFETAAVITSLYFQFAKALYERWYSFSEFYRNARDKEAFAIIMSLAFNRGLWDSGIKNTLVSRKTECKNTANFQNDCAPANAMTLDYISSVVNYCRGISFGGNIYDIALTRQDIGKFIDEIVIPIQGDASIKETSDEIFTCLADANDAISFRYDFKTFFRELIKILPPLLEPANLNYSAP